MTRKRIIAQMTEAEKEALEWYLEQLPKNAIVKQNENNERATQAWNEQRAERLAELKARKS